MPDRGSIRFGVMCHGTSFPAWQARCLEQLLDIEGVEPALLIQDAGYKGLVASRLAKLAELDHLLFNAHYALRVYPGARSMRSVNLSARLAGVPVIRCTVRREGRWSECFTDDDVATIRRHGLDFILRFAFGIIRGDVLEAARLGVWSFHHDDLDKYRGGTPCFWEIFHDDPVTGAVLQRLTNRLGGGVVLERGYLRTRSDSYTANRDRVYFASASWPAQVCKELLNGTRDDVAMPPSQTDAPIFFRPTNSQMLRFGAKVLRNKVRALWQLLHQPVWTIGVVRKRIEDLVDSPELGDVKWLHPLPRGCFLADPFAVRQGNGLRIMAEEYDYRIHRGRIVELESPDCETFTRPHAAIEPGVHSAYPYTFEHGGNLYCLPETSQLGEVALYQADDDPGRWVKVATLVAGVSVVDPTVFQHSGRWWLLGTDYNLGSQSSLCAWYADDLLGPWQEHPANPLKIDVRSSRPAGTPFVHEGRLYRPAQDCSLGYGSGVALNHVEKLTPREFEESPVAVLRPDANGPYPAGLHTLSSCGDVTLVDGMRFALSPGIIISRFGEYLRRRRGGGGSPDQHIRVR